MTATAPTTQTYHVFSRHEPVSGRGVPADGASGQDPSCWRDGWPGSRRAQTDPETRRNSSVKSQNGHSLGRSVARAARSGIRCARDYEVLTVCVIERLWGLGGLRSQA